ncbi:MAG: DUF2304 domain-containing protein [bacterium]
MLIKLILILAIATFIGVLISRLKRKEINGPQFWFWLVLWCCAIAVIWHPEITSYLANMVGVTRGVDLVVYSSVIILFYGLFRMITHIQRLEKAITKIVQESALKDEQKN